VGRLPAAVVRARAAVESAGDQLLQVDADSLVAGSREQGAERGRRREFAPCAPCILPSQRATPHLLPSSPPTQMRLSLLRQRPLPDRLGRLRAVSLFATLNQRELEIVNGFVHDRTYAPGEIIFDEGEEGQALYVVFT